MGYVLTAADVHAMRSAVDVKLVQGYPGQGIWIGGQRRHMVLPVPSRGAYFGNTMDTHKAVHALTNAMDRWRSVSGLVRVGDEVVIEWLVGNHSQVMAEAHLVSDECHLVITRKGQDYRIVLGYLVAPVESSARMVRLVP